MTVYPNVEAVSFVNTPVNPQVDTRNAVDSRTAPRWSSLVAWIAPDVALTLALITLISIFVVYKGSTLLFGDSDTGWHIRNGERIIATGLLPHADPFSFSKPGEPWVAWEWGSDVLMGAVYRASGLAGIALLFGLAIGASVWMWFRLNRAAGGNFLLGCLFFVPMLPTTSIHWLARPHVFSWLFLLGTVWLCERMPLRLGLRHLVMAGIASAAWANIHASFFFAPLILLTYAGGAYLRPWIWKARRRAVGERKRASAGDYVLLAVAASIGTLANPSGWRLHQHVFSYLSNSGLIDHITEFQSFDFHSDGAFQVMVTLAICAAGAFAALAARRPERFLLSILVLAAALRSVRALPVAALLLLPLANASITTVLTRASNLTRGLRNKLDAALKYSDDLGATDSRFRGFAIIPIAAILIFMSIRTQAGFPVAEFPVKASATVATLPPDARILAPDIFGGYLIYRFDGRRKVFFDGRSDFYGTDFLGSYSRILSVGPGWRKEFNRWNFTNVLVPPNYPLIPALEGNGWRELYRDQTAVLLAGRSNL